MNYETCINVHIFLNSVRSFIPYIFIFAINRIIKYFKIFQFVFSFFFEGETQSQRSADLFPKRQQELGLDQVRDRSLEPKCLSPRLLLAVYQHKAGSETRSTGQNMAIPSSSLTTVPNTYPHSAWFSFIELWFNICKDTLNSLWKMKSKYKSILV